MRSVAALALLAGCAEVRFPGGVDDAGGDAACDTADQCGEQCCGAGEHCAVDEVSQEAECVVAAGGCRTNRDACTPEMNADGIPTSANCCNPRHTCFPVGGDGSVGVCDYVAPENACSASDARCTVEFNEDGLATRGDCCLSRQTCFPNGDDGYGICAY